MDNQYQSRILQIAQQLSFCQREGNLDRFPGMKEHVITLINLLRSAMYPSVFNLHAQKNVSLISTGHCLQSAFDLLKEILQTLEPDLVNADTLILSFLETLPRIREVLESDIKAAYDGDPAARNTDEIMLAYPAFEAISIFRMAHELYLLKQPLLARMMTEYAHQLTGIDIHPGATIGDSFFIDHGTGVVIGETTTIGSHVKLYQGVTLGAKSFELDENGNPVKGIKRHPDIGSNVVIYAGATILGGRTKIGDNCIIGGNVWLTHSVDAGSRVIAAEEKKIISGMDA